MKILIIGGRGTAIVIADQIYDANIRFGVPVEVIGLALDDRSNGDEINGYPILCDIKSAYAKYEKYDDVKFIYSLYRPDVMEERSQLLYSLNIPVDKFTNFIHPSVMLSRSAQIGCGNVLLANTVVNSNAERVSLLLRRDLPLQDTGDVEQGDVTLDCERQVGLACVRRESF